MERVKGPLETEKESLFLEIVSAFEVKETEAEALRMIIRTSEEKLEVARQEYSKARAERQDALAEGRDITGMVEIVNSLRGSVELLEDELTGQMRRIMPKLRTLEENISTRKEAVEAARCDVCLARVEDAARRYNESAESFAGVVSDYWAALEAVPYDHHRRIRGRVFADVWQNSALQRIPRLFIDPPTGNTTSIPSNKKYFFKRI